MSASVDALLFQTTQRCHSVFSCFSPLGLLQLRLVASEKVATRFPPVVERTSGSAPRLPMRVTLFRLRLIWISWRLASYLAGQSIERLSYSRQRFGAAVLVSLRGLGNGKAQHQGVLPRAPIVVAPATDFREPTRSIEGTGGRVGVPHLEIE